MIKSKSVSKTPKPKEFPKDFRISPEIQKGHPELVRLILHSESMNDDERQYWYNLAKVMKPEQKLKLQDILIRERDKLAQIDRMFENLPPGAVQPPKFKGRKRDYNEYVGRLIDQGWRPAVIARKLCHADAVGKVVMPLSVLTRLEHDFNLGILKQGKTHALQREVEAVIDQKDPLSIFLNEDNTISAFRSCLKNGNNTSISSSNMRNLTGFQVSFLSRVFRFPWSSAYQDFGLIIAKRKAPMYQLRGELSKSMKWSEENFQRFTNIVRAMVFERDYGNISSRKIKLFMHRYIDLKRQFLTRKIPFDLVFCSESATAAEKRNARNFVRSVLRCKYHGKVPRMGKIIATKDVRYIQKLATLSPDTLCDFPSFSLSAQPTYIADKHLLLTPLQ